MKTQTHKERRTATEEPPWNSQQVNHWGGGAVVVVEGWGWGVNRFYSRETLSITDTAPSYKYMFGPHRGSLPNL